MMVLKTTTATWSPVPEAISEPESVTTRETSDTERVNNSPSKIRRIERVSPRLPSYANFAVWTPGVNAGIFFYSTGVLMKLLEVWCPVSRSTAAGEDIVDESALSVTIVVGMAIGCRGRDESRFTGVMR
jgi:hypothetical protein